jgi:hypothetical protein
MQSSILIRESRGFSPAEKVMQPKWQRIILLCVLAYEGAGALLGGALLIAQPYGSLMKMPVEIMHGTFRNFMIPGVILFLLGVLNMLAFFSVLRKTRFDWMLALGASILMVLWFWVEIAILLELHWLHAMWGLPVLLGLVAAFPLVPAPYQIKALLYCGIVSSLLYVAINVIVPLQWEDYEPASQTISELSAIGAPTRTLWNVLAAPYTFLSLAFAWGVYKAAGQNRRLYISSILLIVYGTLGFLLPFAPIHSRESLSAGGGTLSDTLHIVLAGVTQIIYLIALDYAGAALGKRFRLYSIFTFILLIIFGAFTFFEAPGVAKNEPTPMIGIWERINIGLFQFWTIAFALIMLTRQHKQENQS